MSLPPLMSFDLRDRVQAHLSSSVTAGDGALFGPPVSRGPGPAFIDKVTLSQIDGITSRGWYTIDGRGLTSVTRVVFRKGGQDDIVATGYRNRTDTVIEAYNEYDLPSSGGWRVELEGPNGTVQASLENGVFVSGVWIYAIDPAGIQDTASARQYTINGVGMDYVTSVEILTGNTVVARVNTADQTDTQATFILAEELPVGVYHVRVQPQGTQANGILNVKNVPVRIDGITPAMVTAAASLVEYVIAGSGLDPVYQVYLRSANDLYAAYPVPTPPISTEIRFTPPYGVLRPGVYDVELHSAQGRYGTLAGGLTVTP